MCMSKDKKKSEQALGQSSHLHAVQNTLWILCITNHENFIILLCAVLLQLSTFIIQLFTQDTTFIRIA